MQQRHQIIATAPSVVLPGCAIRGNPRSELGAGPRWTRRFALFFPHSTKRIMPWADARQGGDQKDGMEDRGRWPRYGAK